MQRLLSTLFLTAAYLLSPTTALNCCGSDALKCSRDCSGCTGWCEACLGGVWLIPFVGLWCLPCAVGCTGCAATCAPLLPCVGTTEAQCAAQQNTITVGSRIRDFQMGPTGCSRPPCPLVLVMHGWAMSMDDMQRITQMDSRVSSGDNGGAVVVYPDGTGTGLESCWRVSGATPLGGCHGIQASEEIDYISALIDLMISRHPIDANRVYATGFSNGGTMTMQLACWLSHKIAAFGMVGAGPVPNSLNSWNCPWGERAGQVPILWIHGQQDPMAPHSAAQSTAAALAAKLGYHEVHSDCNAPADISCTRRKWLAHSAGANSNSRMAELSYIRVNPGWHSWAMTPVIPTNGCSGGYCFPTTDRLLNFLLAYNLADLRTPVITPPLPPSPRPPPSPPPYPPTTPSLCADGWVDAVRVFGKCYKLGGISGAEACATACAATPVAGGGSVGSARPVCVSSADESFFLVHWMQTPTAVSCGYESSGGLRTDGCLWISLSEMPVMDIAAAGHDHGGGAAAGQCASPYRLWNEGEPSGDGDCAAAIIGWQGSPSWFDAPCATPARCVCEYTPTTAPPLAPPPPAAPPPLPGEVPRPCCIEFHYVWDGPDQQYEPASATCYAAKNPFAASTIAEHCPANNGVGEQAIFRDCRQAARDAGQCHNWGGVWSCSECDAADFGFYRNFGYASCGVGDDPRWGGSFRGLKLLLGTVGLAASTTDASLALHGQHQSQCMAASPPVVSLVQNPELSYYDARKYCADRGGTLIPSAAMDLALFANAQAGGFFENWVLDSGSGDSSALDTCYSGQCPCYDCAASSETKPFWCMGLEIAFAPPPPPPDGWAAPPCCVEHTINMNGEVLGSTCYAKKNVFGAAEMALLCPANNGVGEQAIFRDCRQAARDAGQCHNWGGVWSCSECDATNYNYYANFGYSICARDLSSRML